MRERVEEFFFNGYRISVLQGAKLLKDGRWQWLWERSQARINAEYVLKWKRTKASQHGFVR